MKNFVHILGLIAIYFVMAKFCLLLAVPPGYSAPIWIPIGVMVVSQFALNFFTVLPATFIASFLVNLSLTYSPQGEPETYLMISAITALGSCLCLTISNPLILRLKKILVERPLKISQTLLFLFLTPMIAALFSSTCGTLDVLYFKIITPDYFFTNWVHWWIGDAIGILLMTPIGYVVLIKKVPLNKVNIARLSFILGFCVAWLFLTFYYANKKESEYLENSFNVSAQQINHKVEFEFKHNASMMAMLSGFFIGSEVVKDYEFHHFLEQLPKDNNHLDQVIWIPSMESKNYQAFYSHAFNKPRFEPLFIKNKIWRKIKEVRSPIIGPQIQNMQLIVYPVIYNNMFYGSLVGIMNTEQLILSATQDSSLQNYQLEITNTNTQIVNYWKNGALSAVEKQKHEGLIAKSDSFQILDTKFQINITTTYSQLFNTVPRAVVVLLFFGLTFAYLFSALQLMSFVLRSYSSAEANYN